MTRIKPSWYAPIDVLTPSTILECANSNVPCLIYNLVDDTFIETYKYKYKTTIPGGFTHISPEIKITVSCSDQYQVTEVEETLTP